MTAYDDTKVGDMPNELFDQLVVAYFYSWVSTAGIRSGNTPSKRRWICEKLVRAGFLQKIGRHQVFYLYNDTIEKHATRVLPPTWRKTHRIGFQTGFRRRNELNTHFFTGEAEDGRLMTFDSASAVHSYSRRVIGLLIKS